MTLSVQELAIINSYKVPIPLATYLHIYTHAPYECYIDHMAGAKELAKYLSPIDLGTDIQLDMEKVSMVIPDMLVSYELRELAKVLKPHTTIPLSTNQIENAIYEHLTQLR